VKPSFTDRELDVMAILWERGPSTVAEVRERIADELAHNTVQTVLRILEDKGFVGEKLFGGSTERLVTHLVSERSIDPQELRRLRRLLDDKIKEGES
jgi:predicted transcriptional regulator